MLEFMRQDPGVPVSLAQSATALNELYKSVNVKAVKA
jgi:hypothetical protein